MLGAAAYSLTPWFILPTAEWVPEPVTPSCLGETAAFSFVGEDRGQAEGPGSPGLRDVSK